jgi:hypothetical protein
VSPVEVDSVQRITDAGFLIGGLSGQSRFEENRTGRIATIEAGTDNTVQNIGSTS